MAITYIKKKPEIIKRAETDKTFRDELKADPKKAIEKHFPFTKSGTVIPEDLEIVVCEDTATKVYLNIIPMDHHQKGW